MLVASRQGQPSNRFKAINRGGRLWGSVFLTQEGTGEGSMRR